MSNVLSTRHLLDEKDLKEVVHIILRYIRLLCLGGGVASLYIERSVEGLELTPKIFKEISIPRTQIYTWEAPGSDRNDDPFGINIRLTINPFERTKLKAKVYFMINHNKLDAILHIKMAKEEGRWLIDSLLAE